MVVALLLVTTPACAESVGTPAPPRWFELVRQVPSVSPGYSWAAAPEVIRAVRGRGKRELQRRSLALLGCINAACEMVMVVQVSPDLIVIDFATGNIDVEVGSQGAAVGSDIEMCNPDGGQKVLDEVLAPARVTNSVIMSMRALVLSSCRTAQTISMSSVGRSIIVNTKSGQGLTLVTEGDGGQGPDFAQEQ